MCWIEDSIIGSRHSDQSYSHSYFSISVSGCHHAGQTSISNIEPDSKCQFVLPGILKAIEPARCRVSCHKNAGVTLFTFSIVSL